MAVLRARSTAMDHGEGVATAFVDILGRGSLP